MKHDWKKFEEHKIGSSVPTFRCKRCHYLMFMKYVLPEDTLMAIGVPDCDLYLVQKVMED